VAGEGIVGLAIDQKANLCDLGKGRVERGDEREQGKGFHLDAGGMVFDEGAVKIDDG
jgi:hypothetical protein